MELEGYLIDIQMWKKIDKLVSAEVDNNLKFSVWEQVRINLYHKTYFITYHQVRSKVSQQVEKVVKL